jgi:hypothetical protein
MDLGQFGMEFLYSAIIALIFTGTGRAWSTITHRRASATTGMQMGQVMGGPPASQPLALPVAPPVARRGVNFGRVLLHIGVFQFAVNVIAFMMGFVIGLALISSGQSIASDSSQLLLLLVTYVVGAIALIVGFLIIGLRVERSVRWLHMTYVALGVAATTLIINVLLSENLPGLATLVGAIIIALLQTFFGMGVGGGLSFLIGGRQDAVPALAPMSQPYPYAAQPSVPLYPGQPAAPSVPLYQPQPGLQAYPPQYPPQQGAPYYPPVPPNTPQYPPQQGAPQYPPRPPAVPSHPYPPNAGQPPRYPPQYPPPYPPQQPPAGGQSGNG